jgi:hypothetical protein
MDFFILALPEQFARTHGGLSPLCTASTRKERFGSFVVKLNFLAGHRRPSVQLIDVMSA